MHNASGRETIPSGLRRTPEGPTSGGCMATKKKAAKKAKKAAPKKKAAKKKK